MASRLEALDLASEKLVSGLSEVLFYPPSHPSLPCRLSVSVDLAPEGNSTLGAGRRGKLSRNKSAVSAAAAEPASCS